jgi:hypothetical protein
VIAVLVACGSTPPVDGDTADSGPPPNAAPALEVGLVELTQALLTGPQAGAGSGLRVLGGDVDGDGLPDLAVGAPAAVPGGSVWLASGAARETWALLDALPGRVSGLADGSSVGASVALGDLDGDGSDDVVIGAPGVEGGAGRVGRFAATQDVQDFALDALWSASGGAGDGLGADLVATPDVDGDGLDDLLLGAPGQGEAAGAVWLLRGGAYAGTLDLDAVAGRLVGEAGAGLGARVGTLGDIDGDGLSEIAAGGPTLATGGAIDVYAGPLKATPILVSPMARVHGASIDDEIGSGPVGGADVDGDGHADLVFGAPSLPGGGGAFVHLAPLVGDVWAATAAIRFVPSGESDGLGAVARAVDLDADGEMDIVVAAPDATDGGACVHFGPLVGTIVWNSGALRITAPGQGDFGTDAAVLDLANDGWPDLVLAGDGATGSGVLFLLDGGVRSL